MQFKPGKMSGSEMPGVLWLLMPKPDWSSAKLSSSPAPKVRPCRVSDVVADRQTAASTDLPAAAWPQAGTDTRPGIGLWVWISRDAQA